MFFNNWENIYRTILVGVPAYIFLVVALRITGKRSLSKMNAFDLVVTVALGSTFATILLSKEVALAEGAVALGLLVFLQYAVTFISVRSPAIKRLIKSQPTLMFYRGQFLEDVMVRERVMRVEVQAAIREQGIADLSDVEAVVLETDGQFTVIKRDPEGKNDALAGIAGYEERYEKQIEL